MKRAKQPATILVAVKIPVAMDQAIEKRCRRDDMLKREFFMLACRKLLEATNA